MIWTSKPMVNLTQLTSFYLGQSTSRSTKSLPLSQHRCCPDPLSCLNWLVNWKGHLVTRVQNLLKASEWPSPIPRLTWLNWKHLQTLSLRKHFETYCFRKHAETFYLTLIHFVSLSVIDPVPYPNHHGQLPRSVQALEECIDLLNVQFGACELVKLDAAALRNGDTADAEKLMFPVYVFDQLWTDVGCFSLSWQWGWLGWSATVIISNYLIITCDDHWWPYTQSSQSISRWYSPSKIEPE